MSALPSRRLTRRRKTILWVSAFAIAVLLLTLGRPLLHIATTAFKDTDGREPLGPGWTDDASRLNATPIAGRLTVSSTLEQAEDQLRGLLKRAAAEGFPVAIAGARHSMGGQTIPPNGYVVDMLPLNHMRFDPDRETVVVGAGALWSDVLRYLSTVGRSIPVMQSNSSFSVGGSLSVNCHGWQVRSGPIASTVRSIRLMLADGTVVPCSREENGELFAAALGGYGLFGIILEAEIKTCPNTIYRLDSRVFAVEKLVDTFDECLATQPTPEMAFARLCIVPGSAHFLSQGVWNFFRAIENPESLTTNQPERYTRAARLLFRGSEGNDYGKRLRWQIEQRFAESLSGSAFRRNDIMNQGVEAIENRSATTTDILHEYFVPGEHITEFLRGLSRIVSQQDVDLLNVTVRVVEEDVTTMLRFADRRMFSFVLLFVQDRTDEASEAMTRLTRDIIDLALSLNGRYYLPYRLHATPAQFERAYPMASRFFELKRRYDPHEILQNRLYSQYGQRHSP